MSEPLRYIHIGVGGFGQHWCTIFLPRLRQLGLAEPVAAVDINPEVLAKAKDQLGLDDDQLYTSAAQAFDKHKADFITIVVPPAFHEEMVDLAVAHGCHILSEKPIADSMAACCRIYRKVSDAGLKMAVTMSHRFDQDKQTLEREIKSGRYGRLSSVIGRNTWECRAFGSWGRFRHEIPDPLLVEGAVHHFDIIRALCGADAQTVYAATWNPPWGEYAGDSNGLITMIMTNGVRAFYEGNKTSATTLNGWSKDYFRAECELATLELDNRRLRVMSDLDGERVCTEKPLLQQDVWTNAWLAELFVRWLNGGEAPPNALADNIQCAALLFAAIESAHSGEVLDVQEFLKAHMAAAEGGG
ncbi:MAG: gfo/Idh/MocA family oxidoreductase [Chitinivibrionales bacterium]|nr:gfo/Idh/MocA family oxidoreductase [Chitinivibrionales bacterium]